MLRSPRAFAALLATLALAAPAPAAWIWVEAERPQRSSVTRHPDWYDQVRREALSGGDFITNWGDRPGELTYAVKAPAAGSYVFWVRANPVATRLSYSLDGGRWTPIEMAGAAGENVASDGKVDLRFLAWVRAGEVSLRAGANSVRFRMESENNHHGALDCFVFSDEPFTPRGLARPGEPAHARATPENKGWFAFDPPPDRPGGVDLRALNEPTAGDGGFIAAREGRFVHGKTGEPLRFWAVNGPAGKDLDGLRRDALMLARRGVNLARIHHGYFDPDGRFDPAQLKGTHDVIEAMRREGIYTHLSIYFPLWLAPKADNPFLKGYDGKKPPFAALFFNQDFQATYRGWWKALLLAPSPHTGRRIIDEPAVFGLELINEDSYFFWTFNEAGVPDPQLRIVEAKFAAWLAVKYGSVDRALSAWGGGRLPRDRPEEGRVAFRPLWNIANERTSRDKDTARFLLESQRSFYESTIRYLRELGFKGVITASNWTTASAEILGPLEKYSYTPGDFIDRHGYLSCDAKGEAAEWSLREGQTYADRSALRFDPEEPGKPKDFSNPVADPSYDGKPSMISETTFNRPNRYRSEAPLFLACYGALQASAAIVHFNYAGASWTTKPGYFVQPWDLATPAMLGQFPAAALIFRKGLVAPGDLLVDLDLPIAEILDLKGTSIAQRAALDELRRKDVAPGRDKPRGLPTTLDPLVHFAGRVNINFTPGPGRSTIKESSRYIDRAQQVVTSTHGQLRLDYGRGLLRIDAPAAQGASGALKGAGTIALADLSVASSMELGHVVAVALDDRPLGSSRKVLLQVMSEERPDGFRSEPAGAGLSRIAHLGGDPWLVKEIEGTVGFRRPDARTLKVRPLDGRLEPGKPIGDASEIRLRPDVLYYLIAP